jgi:hypothetical protein
MKNRDFAINTFDGGMDVDLDNKALPSNKYREGNNIDIRKSGNSAAVTDLKGETVLAVIEDLSVYSTTILAVIDAQFLVEPTGQVREALVIFYIRQSDSATEFVIKSMFLDNNNTLILFSESITQEAYEFLQDSTVSLQKVGLFGYDVIYFVDYYRQPRKIDCVLYSTNDVEVTITLNGMHQMGDGRFQVQILVHQDGVANDPYRAYVQAYKTGQQGSSPNNPLTNDILYAEFDGFNTLESLFFNIYPEDFASYTFVLRHYRDGNEIHRNFIIGSPNTVQVAVGVLEDTTTIYKSNIDGSSMTQVGSWDFLYDGIISTPYIDTPTIEVGTTKIYNTELEAPFNLLADGFYQQTTGNQYIEVSGGVIIDVGVNNATLNVEVIPSGITSYVQSEATDFPSGIRNRLDSVSFNLPTSITNTEDEIYHFYRIVAGTKSSTNPIWSYTLERSSEINPQIEYLPDEVDLRVDIINELENSPGNYELTFRIQITSQLSTFIDVAFKARAWDTDSEQEITGIQDAGVIPEGETFVDVVVNFGHTGPANFGNACVDNYIYTGYETVTVENPCQF